MAQLLTILPQTPGEILTRAPADTPRPPTFAVYTLGCKVNQADSNGLARILQSKGFERVEFREAADLYVIDTCTVTNEAGRPLEYAQVTLDPDGGTRQVRTDRDGRYSFLGVPQGVHSLRVTWVGFTPETKQVEVTSGDVTADFVLRRVTRLDTVAVTAKRTGLYGSVVSKDSLRPVPGARIEIIGARKADSTNSSGTP